jgi:glutamate-ammonia-ligase adenylyltransferase
VDLVYLHDDVEPAPGSVDPKVFFSRLASEVTRAIGEPTVEGLVFRVDLRLRPEGHAGVLVNSVEGALTYYEGWGDTWERGALAKARPVGGDLALGIRFIEEIRPFVYRRHLDFQTLEDLRRMKDKVDAEQAVQAPGVRDVKLGSGCIRELEFVVQALQLIHGGHEPDVRVTGTRAALDALERHSMISASEAAALRDAYVFLRDVEHAVQVVEQRRTQRLPADADGLRALARRLGYGPGRRGRPAVAGERAAFEADWARHTERVREAFVRFLELQPHERARIAADDPGAAAILASLERGDRHAAESLLSAMGFPDASKAADALQKLYRGRIGSPASPQRRRAVESMAPALLRAAVSSADPDGALDRLVDFLVRTGAHTSYLALLGGSQATMSLLVTVFATSPYLASLLVGHPELIDLLVRSDAASGVRDHATLTAELGDLLASCDDEEQVMSALRAFRNAEVLRVGMEDLAGVLAPEQVHQRLTLLAEVCLLHAVEEGRRLAAQRAQQPAELRLAILALGKMGAGEMTYASDLDLIFVYDAARDDGGAAHGFATRWVQKAMSLLQTRTRDGIVYSIDARLRPSGRSGPLVISLERFVEYHREEAELWERQAHIRARVAYGDQRLGARISEVVERFVYGAGLDAAGAREIDGLRRRIETELAKEGPRKTNIKTGRGGILDIEFVVQMLQLRHGSDVPSVRARATLGALRALRDAGLVAAQDADRMASHYTFLRRLEARMRLERDRPVEELGTDTRVLAPLARRLGFGGDDPGARLLEACERTREDVRRLYQRYFDGVDV